MDWYLAKIDVSDARGIDSVVVTLYTYEAGFYTYADFPASLVDGVYQAQARNAKRPGNYIAQVTVWDNDNDWTGDKLEAFLEVPYTVADDDTEPPTISNVIINDALYGTTVTDEPDFLLVTFSATDASGIDKVYVQVVGGGGAQATLINGVYQARVFSPKEPGTYTLQVMAVDADLDDYYEPWRDQLWSSFDLQFEVIDDDTAAPDITKVDFLGHNLDTDPYIWMRLFVSDPESGVGIVTVDFNGGTYYAYTMGDPAWVLALLPNPHVSSTYTAYVTAWDADNDRAGDALSNSTDVIVTVTNSAPKVRLFYSNAAGVGGVGGGISQLRIAPF